MFKYQCTVHGDKVDISVNASHADEVAACAMFGPKTAVSELRIWLERQYGIYGHLFDLGNATPLDLHAILSSPTAKELYSPSLIEGNDVLTNRSEPPEGAVT